MTSAVLNLIPPSTEPRSVLIAGSGPTRMQEWADHGFSDVYLDIEPRNNPDIVASMTAMGDIGPYDVVFCCHALEHLYPHEVNWALCEFKRVLKPGGMAIVMVPDLEDVRPTNERLTNYLNGAEITGLHLYYGDVAQIPEFPYMAHHCGFVADTMKYALKSAGFDAVVTERMQDYNLMGIGFKK